jgi:hypothetical protein
MYIVLWYGSGDAVKVSRGFSQWVLNSSYRGETSRVYLKEAAHKEAKIWRR